MYAVQIVLLYIQAFIASTSLFADLKYKDISEIYKMREVPLFVWYWPSVSLGKKDVQSYKCTIVLTFNYFQYDGIIYSFMLTKQKLRSKRISELKKFHFQRQNFEFPVY